MKCHLLLAMSYVLSISQSHLQRMKASSPGLRWECFRKCKAEYTILPPRGLRKIRQNKYQSVVTLHSGQTPRMWDHQAKRALQASVKSSAMWGGGTRGSKAERVPVAFCADSRSYCQNTEPRLKYPKSINSPHPASPIRHPLVWGSPRACNAFGI